VFDAALLSHALLREDADFYRAQNLQPAMRQYFAWQDEAEAAPILIAARRYLAAPFLDGARTITPPSLPVA
jgi:hypothetical protein